MKKVVVISSTPVKGGNSELLCKAFAQGAEEAGWQVEMLNLREKQINFCRERNSTKPRLWQRKQSIEQAESLTVSLPRSRSGMRAASGVNAVPAAGKA